MSQTLQSISDEEQYAGLATHHALLKEITNREFKPFMYDYFNPNPQISVMGYEMFPVAVELSQWGFPTDYIAEDEKGAKQARIDSERQAGKFRKITAGRLSSSKILVWGGILSNMGRHERKDFIKECLDSSAMIVCSELTKINWEKEIGRDYKVTVIRYYSNRYLILHITRK